jgi:hypothetical protein
MMVRVPSAAGHRFASASMETAVFNASTYKVRGPLLVAPSEALRFPESEALEAMKSSAYLTKRPRSLCSKT